MVDQAIDRGERHGLVWERPFPFVPELACTRTGDLIQRLQIARRELALQSATSAFCKPSAKATKLSPPSTIWACSNPENGSRKPEVIKPVVERFARDRDAESAHVGEIRGPFDLAVLLTQDHISVGTVEARHLAMRRSNVRRTPVAVSECRRHSSSKIATARMPGCGIQHRHDLNLPHAGEWVTAARHVTIPVKVGPSVSG
jgi:hypothetical protein